MLQPVVIVFIAISIVFAATHTVAVNGFYYWLYWWFDLLMHFWGGLLIALGLTALSTFRRFNFKTSYRLVFWVALAMVIIWEVFEWVLGVISPQEYWLDTSIDIFLGIFGALLGFALLKKFRI